MMHFLTGILFSSLLCRGLAVEAKFGPRYDLPGNKKLMRSQDREETDTAGSYAQLGASGEFVKIRNDPEKDCHDSYILGSPDTNDCTDGDLHANIITESPCEKAAEAAGVSQGMPSLNLSFNLGDDSLYKETHPRGCFKDKQHNAFFYNPIGYKPTPDGNWTARGGTPVCTRERYRNGSIQSASDYGCPAGGYSVITTRGACLEYAECSSYSHNEDEFDVGAPAQINNVANPAAHPEAWAQQYNDMPRGCFIREENGYVYFNTPHNDTSGNPTIYPTNPQGTPLCWIPKYSDSTS
jgi:hypothetical protein